MLQTPCNNDRRVAVPSRPNKISNRNTPLPASFGNIDFGEEDANLDYEVSIERDSRPVFINAFFSHPSLQLDQLESAHKYIVLGQKGTGKTAVLRKLQQDIEALGGITQFMIFRDEVASREELDKLGAIFAVSLSEVKKAFHHLYAVERMLLLMVASQVQRIADQAKLTEDQAKIDDDDRYISLLIKRVFKQPLNKIIEATLDSVARVADSLTIDTEKATKGIIKSDPSILLRNINDKLLETCVKGLKGNDQRVAIFVDEIHFTYRSGQDHDQDASLVRDLIRTIGKLNRVFAREKVPCRVFAAIRSEFIDHPLISAAELHQYLRTYGFEISWSTFPANFEHPMFDIGALRVDASQNVSMTGKAFMRACFVNFSADDASEFVKSTWSKPRDIIRFLRTCKDMFPDKLTLTRAQYLSVFHQSCIHAWKEVEIALTSFLTLKGVEAVRKLLASKSSESLERGSIGTVDAFLLVLKPIAKSQTQVGVMTEPESLFGVLYMLGCVYTTRTTQGGSIIHSFHRGQSNPDWKAQVAIHRGVAKAFS